MSFALKGKLLVKIHQISLERDTTRSFSKFGLSSTQYALTTRASAVVPTVVAYSTVRVLTTVLYVGKPVLDISGGRLDSWRERDSLQIFTHYCRTSECEPL
jgi:hypothetical protein